MTVSDFTKLLILVGEQTERIAELEEFRTKANARMHRLSDALEEIVQRCEGSSWTYLHDVDNEDAAPYHIAKKALEVKS